MTLDEYFEGWEESRRLFEALRLEIESLGPAAMRVTKSQVAFARKRTFARAWIPGKYLRGRIAPLVLTLAFRSRDRSPRWKSVVEPSPGKFTHHLELGRESDIDAQVRAWLQKAREAAG